MKKFVLGSFAALLVLALGTIVYFGSNFGSPQPDSFVGTNPDDTERPSNSKGRVVGSDGSVPTDTLVQPAPLPVLPEELAQQFTRQLKAASLAFNVPERLKLNETATVELALAPATQSRDAETVLSSDLRGKIVIQQTEYSLNMEARLIGEDFDIPESRQQKLVLPNRPSKWVWQVTPRKPGQRKRLTLELHALLSNPNGNLAPLSVQTLKRDIVVEVTLWENMLGKLQAFDTLQASIAGIIGLGGSIFGIFGWLRRRKAKTE